MLILLLDPHIDSIKFSGEIVAGLSLLSPRVFRLSLDEKFKHLHDSNISNRIEFIAYPRRLYILSDALRYHYNHAVLSTNATDLFPDSTFPIERRMSLIFRDELEGNEGGSYLSER